MLEEVLRGGLGAFDMWIAADDGTGKVASVKGGGVESEHAELLSRLLLLLDWKSTVVSFHDILSGGKSESYTHLLFPKEIFVLSTDFNFNESKFKTDITEGSRLMLLSGPGKKSH